MPEVVPFNDQAGIELSSGSIKDAPAAVGGVGAATTSSMFSAKKLTLIPLIFIIFFQVSGGPYGMEAVISSAGPLLGLLGFIVFPVACSMPEALVAAELATAMPGNGGFVLWTSRAFGPYLAHLMGTWKFLSSAINTATYPALCADYLSGVLPALAGGRPRLLMIIGMIFVPTFLNYIGVAIVGYMAVTLAVLSELPLLIMTVAAVPNLKARRWTAPVKKKDWKLYVNTLFWGLNYWDNASTFAEEVAKPHLTFPRALACAGVVTVVTYVVPLMMAVGALRVGPDQWVNGFLANAGGKN